MFKSLGQAIAKTSQNLPLRSILLVPFVLQIVGAVGAVGYLSFRNGQDAVNDLATQLRKELTARIERELGSYFNLPYDINQLNTISFVRGDLDLVTGENASQFLQQLRISPFIYSVYCGDSRGQFLGATRLQDRHDSLGIWNANQSTGQHLFHFYTDNLGNRSFLFRDAGAYDPRIRPWYKAALREERPVWSDVYLAFSTKLPAITASQPVYDSTGNHVVGVCATDVLLTADLGEFLASLSIGKSGHAFIIDRSGILLSSSTDDPIAVGEGENIRLLEATQSGNPLVQSTAQQLFESFGESLQNIRNAKQLDFRLGGERQLVQVVPFNDGYGLDLLIVVVLPESDFMAQIHANRTTTIILCLSALMVATIVGIWTSRWLTHPLFRLSQASQVLARGRLDQTVQVSRIKELKVLARSFNQMSQQLKFSFEALEDANQELARANEELEERVEARTAELTESQRVLSTLMSNLPGMAYRLTNEGTWTLTFASQGCYDLTGYQPEELTGNHTADYMSLVHRDDLVNLLREMQLAIEERRSFQATYRLITASGEACWVWDQGRGVFGTDGKLLAIEGFLTDISDRQQARLALEQKSQRDNLLSKISRTLINQDLDTAVTLALKAVGEITGSDRCYVIDFNRDLARFDTTNEWCRGRSGLRPNPFRSSPVGVFPWLYAQYKLGKAVQINQLTDLPAEGVIEMAVLRQHSIQSLLMVPMLHGDRVMGSIGLDTTVEARHWSEQDVQMLQLVAEMLAIAQARQEAELALRQEQEKSDQLLLNILPEPIAHRLKQDQSAIAESFDEVSILFADLVNFTPLSSRLAPTELVDLLNRIFSNFDELAASFGLEKIKTIGDAYMVASGLPLPKEDHAEAIADMALAMQIAVESFQTELGDNFQIRIGINTGAVVAGVIGVNKFIYDLWGDTVNVASRMESTGEPGHIQVTVQTYDRLKHQYWLEERGMTAVKGKGELLTYWLKGRKV
jgi:PAS domain S-box-containing protein